MFFVLSNVAAAQPFRLSVFSNTFEAGDTVYIEAKQADSFVVINNFIPKDYDKDLFGSIQFKEAAFLRIRNNRQTVNRKFYVDGAVSLLYDTTSKTVLVNGSAATALSDSFYNSFTDQSVVTKLNNVGYKTVYEYSSDSISSADKYFLDTIIPLYKDFIRKHPNSYFSVDMIEWCSNKLSSLELYDLLQLLHPLMQKHSLVKWQLSNIRQQISQGTAERVPVFKVVDERSNTFKDQDLQQGIFLIDFWGTWCGPCIEAMPKLVKMAKKFEAKVVFISYAMQINSTPFAFEAAEKKYGISWKSFFENRNKPTGVADVFKIEGYPTYLLVKDGVILKKVLSARGLPQIESMIERLLKEK